MSQYVNVGDKVNAGSSSSGAITLSHQSNIFTSDANITTTAKIFTITSALIDAYTVPVVSVQNDTSYTGAVTVSIGAMVATSETLTNGAAASITPGTLKIGLTAVTTSTTVAPKVCVTFL